MELDANRYTAIRNKLMLAEIYLEDGAPRSAMKNLIEARALLETAAPARAARR